MPINLQVVRRASFIFSVYYTIKNLKKKPPELGLYACSTYWLCDFSKTPLSCSRPRGLCRLNDTQHGGHPTRAFRASGRSCPCWAASTTPAGGYTPCAPRTPSQRQPAWLQAGYSHRVTGERWWRFCAPGQPGVARLGATRGT